ncbi:hypothetical protein MA16_Dca028564 [Dendrobium catenatum]|uniref:Uncharacterized protein n=1 Tax=Dendrobium catenatum TaxID=906689 RepID=A0A2I0VGN2_9ASPA|nr:hypothetical protein MA16_Dca028564 [Dendrobium catenatum]
MNFSRFGEDSSYDLIYASAVFLHIPDHLVWVGLERLALKLKPMKGRIFISHNIKFCSRIKKECPMKLEEIGLDLSSHFWSACVGGFGDVGVEAETNEREVIYISKYQVFFKD